MTQYLNLKCLVLCVCIKTLVGCGFQLRGQTPIPENFKTLVLVPDEPYTPQQRAIRSLFRANGIRFYEGHDEQGISGYYQIHLLEATITRDVIIIGTDAQAKQEQIIIAQRYRVVPPGGDPLPIQIISEQRMLAVDQNRVLGQDQEEIVLMQEMRDDIAQQLLKRVILIPQHTPHHPEDETPHNKNQSFSYLNKAKPHASS